MDHHVGNDSSLKFGLPITISAWVKLHELALHHYVIRIDDQATANYGIWFKVSASDNKMLIGYGDGGVPGSATRRTKKSETVLTTEQGQLSVFPVVVQLSAWETLALLPMRKLMMSVFMTALYLQEKSRNFISM